MKERFKELRKTLNVTQQEFADKLKISRNFVAQIEMGNKVPSDRTLDDVCEKFNVREEWLKDGKGEMFHPLKRNDEISKLLGYVTKTNDDDFKYRLINALAKLDDSGWDSLEKLIDAISMK